MRRFFSNRHSRGTPEGRLHSGSPEKTAGKARRHMDPRRLSAASQHRGGDGWAIRLFLLLFCVMALSGCITREQADAKLARACEAAVEVFLDETQRIDKIKNATYSASPVGPDFRHVTIHTVMVDGWLETEYDYECIFQEGFGFLNSGYTASIEQVRVDETTIGRAGGEIMGDAQDFIKMTDAVRKALYED